MPLAQTYNEPSLASWTDRNDVYLVSDLHMADGRTGPFGKFTQGENFFWDESFDRFLKGISQQGHSQTLVINGDFFDFLRVNRIPHKENPEDAALVQHWTSFLKAVNHPAASLDLYSADDSEKEYGFKTHDYKSVWKLLLIFLGHKVFFDALRQFLQKDDNRLLIVKGNHDIELFWEAVRQAFVFFLANDDAQLYAIFNERTRFYQQSLIINNEMYIEHGHLLEEITGGASDTLPGNPQELALPVGSLFNRYVINKIEEIDPLFDNIKPPTNILKAVALHYPKKIFKIVFYHFIGAWKIVRKNHVAYAAKIIGKIFGVGLPVLVFAALAGFLYFKLQTLIASDVVRWIINTAISLLGAAAVRWVQSRLAGADQSVSLLSCAKSIYQKHPALKLITFGHTHTSEMNLAGPDCWYLNSGTWIPTIEIDTYKVRDTNTFCVLRVLNKNGSLQREPLLRWNDDSRDLEQTIFFLPSS